MTREWSKTNYTTSVLLAQRAVEMRCHHLEVLMESSVF